MQDDVRDIAMQGDVRDIAMQDDVRDIAMQGGVRDIAMQGDVRDIAMQGDVRDIAMQDDMRDIALQGDVRDRESSRCEFDLYILQDLTRPSITGEPQECQRPLTTLQLQLVHFQSIAIGFTCHSA